MQTSSYILKCEERKFTAVPLLYVHLGPNRACFWRGHRELCRERAVPSEAAEQQQNLSRATAATLGLHTPYFPCISSPRRCRKPLLPPHPHSPIPAAQGQAVLEAEKRGHKRSMWLQLHWAVPDPWGWARACAFLPVSLMLVPYEPFCPGCELQGRAQLAVPLTHHASWRAPGLSRWAHTWEDGRGKRGG